MRIIAIAKPNKNYIYFTQNFSDVTIEARKMDKKIIFYEVHKNNPNWIVPVKSETVKELFTRSTRIKDVPFLKKENRAFYSILKRNTKKFKSEFSTLIQDPVPNNIVIRTKMSEVTRMKKPNSENVIRLRK